MRDTLESSSLRKVLSPYIDEKQGRARGESRLSFYCINCRSKTDPGFKACPYCGDPITDFLRQYIETPIDGKYRILSRLGVGGMGEVYKVLHLHLNAPRVVKMMRPNLSTDQRAHERFIREAQLATRIQHPNVAALFDFSTLGDGSYYMVWEYIDGITFADLIRAGGFLSPRYAALLSIQVLDGLQAIHRQGVVHRDISPENVMITFDDEGNERVKIIDLGIAKQWADDTDDKTKTGMFVGKWKYCSPEHLGMLKPDERIDGLADIYSYGIVLYELLTGRVPFIADSPHRFLLLHSTESPPSLAESNPELEDVSELEAILLRALEKDRSKRFRSARQFAAALEAILPSLPDRPGLPTGGARPEITTSDRNVQTVESSNQGTGATAAASSEAETVESSALEIPTGDAPFIAPDAHATSETRIETVDEAVIFDEDATVPESNALRSLDQRTLSQPPIDDTPVREQRAARWPWAALLLILVAVAVALFVTRAKDDVAQAGPDTATTTGAADAPASPAERSIVGINAWPWGTIDRLENVDTGESIELEDPVTPVSLDLEPGSYRVVMSNPSYSASIRESFEVVAGRPLMVSLQFTDGEPVRVPSIGSVQ